MAVPNSEGGKISFYHLQLQNPDLLGGRYRVDNALTLSGFITATQYSQWTTLKPVQRVREAAARLVHYYTSSATVADSTLVHSVQTVYNNVLDTYREMPVYLTNIKQTVVNNSLHKHVYYQSL